MIPGRGILRQRWGAAQAGQHRRIVRRQVVQHLELRPGEGFGQNVGPQWDESADEDGEAYGLAVNKPMKRT